MRPEEQVSADARVTRKRALLTLVIPTRNEAGNVPRLVRELGEALTGVEYRVVFVDDSTDETPTVIRDLSEEDGRISLIHRASAEQDGGLSTAVATGMDAVANESEYTCVMDADLQHPPEKVRELLEKARFTGADVVVASRYVRGGSYTGLPGRLRKAISVGSEYLAHIISLFLYIPSAGRFWKFALVGASGVLVNLLTLITLVEYFDAGPTVAWIIAVGLSILSNFLLNNAFTWRDVRHSSRIHFLLRGALAYPVAIIALGANFAVYYPLIKYFSADFPYYTIAAFLSIVAGTSANFILSSRFVFRPSKSKGLDPKAPPEVVAEEAREELKADWVGLVRAGDLSPVALSSTGIVDSSLPFTTADRSAIELVLRTSQPTLVVTGPRRLPQARTNTCWTSSLAVPVLDGDYPVGVVYATRTSTEQFTQEDLHWLTAYASTSIPMFVSF